MDKASGSIVAPKSSVARQETDRSRQRQRKRMGRFGTCQRSVESDLAVGLCCTSTLEAFKSRSNRTSDTPCIELPSSAGSNRRHAALHHSTSGLAARHYTERAALTCMSTSDSPTRLLVHPLLQALSSLTSQPVRVTRHVRFSPASYRRARVPLALRPRQTVRRTQAASPQTHLHLPLSTAAQTTAGSSIQQHCDSRRACCCRC